VWFSLSLHLISELYDWISAQITRYKNRLGPWHPSKAPSLIESKDEREGEVPERPPGGIVMKQWSVQTSMVSLITVLGCTGFTGVLSASRVNDSGGSFT